MGVAKSHFVNLEDFGYDQRDANRHRSSMHVMHFGAEPESKTRRLGPLFYLSNYRRACEHDGESWPSQISTAYV